MKLVPSLYLLDISKSLCPRSDNIPFRSNSRLGFPTSQGAQADKLYIQVRQVQVASHMPTLSQTVWFQKLPIPLLPTV